MYLFGSNPGHPGEDPFWTLGQPFEQTRLRATRQCDVSNFKTVTKGIILKSDNWPCRGCLKVFFSIFSSGDHFVQPTGTILAYLVESHPKNISVKLFENWSIGLGVDII